MSENETPEWQARGTAPFKEDVLGAWYKSQMVEIVARYRYEDGSEIWLDRECREISPPTHWQPLPPPPTEKKRDAKRA